MWRVLYRSETGEKEQREREREREILNIYMKILNIYIDRVVKYIKEREKERE